MEFMEFDNVDEMFVWMRARTIDANAHLADAQREVTWGSYWMRLFDPPIVIFGKVSTEAEMVADETKVKPGEDPAEVLAEAEWTIARLRENHEAGYMFGMAYSLIEPEGEWGDTHRANLWPISEKLFLDAKACGWDMRVLRDGPYEESLAEFESAFRAIRLHNASIAQ